MKALWCNHLFVVVETFHANLLLQHVEDDTQMSVSLSDERLIIDPTDGDLDEAAWQREAPHRCCDCPHLSYFTIHLRDHKHECHDCGDVFVDRYRIKKFFNSAASRR